MMPDPAVLQYPQGIALPPKSFILYYSLSLSLFWGITEALPFNGVVAFEPDSHAYWWL